MFPEAPESFVHMKPAASATLHVLLWSHNIGSLKARTVGAELQCLLLDKTNKNDHQLVGLGETHRR